MPLILLVCTLQSMIGRAVGDEQSDDGQSSGDPAVVEISRQPVSGSDEPVKSDSRSGNYLELGLGIVDYRTVHRRHDSENPYPGLYLEGAFYWRALFVEVNLTEGENYGATLWQDERWALDLLVASVVAAGVSDEEGTPADTEAERTQQLYDREAVLIGSGFRLSRYSGPTLLRFQVLGDIYESHGFGARVHVGRRWQFGNWDARALVGASWMSERTADYLFGIDADEATSTLPAVEVGDSAVVELSLSASYPLSRHWVFHADASFNRFDDGISRSALVERPYESLIGMRLGYVF